MKSFNLLLFVLASVDACHQFNDKCEQCRDFGCKYFELFDESFACEERMHEDARYEVEKCPNPVTKSSPAETRKGEEPDKSQPMKDVKLNPRELNPELVHESPVQWSGINEKTGVKTGSELKPVPPSKGDVIELEKWDMKLVTSNERQRERIQRNWCREKRLLDVITARHTQTTPVSREIRKILRHNPMKREIEKCDIILRKRREARQREQCNNCPRFQPLAQVSECEKFAKACASCTDSGCVYYFNRFGSNCVDNASQVPVGSHSVTDKMWCPPSPTPAPVQGSNVITILFTILLTAVVIILGYFIARHFWNKRIARRATSDEHHPLNQIFTGSSTLTTSTFL